MDNTSYDIAGGSKFVLSLDGLDLSLLPNTYRPWRATPGTLWRNTNFLPEAQEYFEFKINTKFDIDDDTAHETTHRVCYICNTSVPKDYVNDHLNSSKHIAYQKITEVAIERARKHKRITGTEQIKIKSEYFCEHCVLTVHSSNRNEHEKSKTHRNHAALDAFLNNFALFYSNNDIGDIIKSPIFDNPQDDSNISLVKVNSNTAEDLKSETENDFEIVSIKTNDNSENIPAELKQESTVLENKLKESVGLISNIETCLENTYKEMNNNITNHNENKEAVIITNLEQYIKLLKKYGTIKLHPVDSFNQNCIIIETSDGIELKISTFNFHGFKRLGTYVRCTLCQTIVKDVNNHRTFENHIKVVAQPFKDKHCIRRLKDNLSHCVLCNEIIDKVMVHSNLNHHVRNVDQATIPKAITFDNIKTVNADHALSKTDSTNISTSIPGNPKPENTNTLGINVNSNFSFRKYKTIKDLSDNQHYCTICNIHMHKNNIDGHLNGTKHLLNSKSGMYYLMSKDENNWLTCEVCHTNVTFYTWAVKDHITSTEHVSNYNKSLANNKIHETKDGLFCQICGNGFPRSDVLSHIKNVGHQIKLTSHKINDIDKNIKIKDTYLGPVDVNVTVENVPVERNGTDEIKKLSENLEIADSGDVNILLDQTAVSINLEDPIGNTKSITTISNNDPKMNVEHTQHNDGHQVRPFDTFYECNICNEKVTNHTSTIKTHKDSIKHKTMDELLTGVNNLLEELLTCFNNPIEIHSHMQQTDIENILYCKVCNDKILIENTEKHTNSLNHIHKHRDLMAVNKLKLRNDIYVCYACNVYVEIGNEIRHIETVEHEKRMESLKNGDYVLITIDNKKLIDKIHSELKLMEQSNGEAKLREIKFGDFIPMNSILTSEENTNVNNHFCNLIDNEKQLICILCQELVGNTKNETKTHILCGYHEEKYITVMTYNQTFPVEDGFVCGFCECSINDNEFKHVVSEKHIANQKSYPNKNFCFTCNESTIDLGVKKHFTSEQHMKKISSPAYFYCNICHIHINNDAASIQRHNEGFEHMNHASIFDENKVVFKNKKCLCQVCETVFSRGCFDDHIDSLNHIMLLHRDYYDPSSVQCCT